MGNATRLRPLVFILTLSWLALLSTSVAMGEDQTSNDNRGNGQEKTWDQSDVTKLAIELEQTLQEAYEGSLNAPRQRTAIQQRERDAAQGVIRRARDLGQEYAQRMRDGWDRESSDPYFRAVAEGVAQIWQTAGDAKPAARSRPTIERLQGLLEMLRSAYDGP